MQNQHSHHDLPRYPSRGTVGSVGQAIQNNSLDIMIKIKPICLNFGDHWPTSGISVHAKFELTRFFRFDIIRANCSDAESASTS